MIFNLNGFLLLYNAFYMNEVLENINDSFEHGFFLLSPYCERPDVACTHTAEPSLALGKKQLRLSMASR